MNNRKFVMVQSTEKEKEEYKQASEIRGFKGKIAPWMTWLAKRDLRLAKKMDHPNA